jgi:hypothetical protein
MVTVEFPVLVKEEFKSLSLPTLTLPKLRLGALKDSSCVPASPVPLNAIVSVELGALLISEIEPVTAPAVPGANSALNVVFEPAGIIIGALRPEMLNPVPVTVAFEITRLDVPLLVRLIVCELLLPVATFPKLAVLGMALISAWPEPVVFTGGLAPVVPVQLESPRIAIMTASRIIKASGPAGRLFLDLASSACELLRSGWVGVCVFMNTV